MKPPSAYARAGCVPSVSNAPKPDTLAIENITRVIMRNLIYAISLLLSLTSYGKAEKTDPAFDTAKIESVTGLKGTYHPEEAVFKVSSPRTDVKISVDGWTMPPFMGLTSWAAF